MLTFAEALAGEDTINHPISAGSQVLRGRIPATSSFFEPSVRTNESWAVATASSEQQPCDASKSCEGGLGEQLSVQGRRRIARSTESGRSTHRAKASARKPPPGSLHPLPGQVPTVGHATISLVGLGRIGGRSHQWSLPQGNVPGRYTRVYHLAVYVSIDK